MNYPKPTISPYKGVIIRRVFIPVLLCLSFLLVIMQASAQVSEQKLSPQTAPGAPGTGIVTGPTSSTSGATTGYSVSASGATSYTWSLTPIGAGEIAGSGSIATVTWDSGFTGSGIVHCTATNSSGSTPATPLTVHITSASPLVAGTISLFASYINYNTSPRIAETPATGGNNTYTYQWQSTTTNGGTFVPITGATNVTYAPVPAITVTTYYRRMDSSNGTSLPTNTVTENVYPQLLAGTASPTSQTVTSGATPQSNITVTGISGGAGSSSYTYQWQSSPDGLAADFVNIPVSNASATTVTLSPGPVYSPTYYRLAVTSNGGTAYSSSSIVAISDCYQLNSNPGAATNYIISNTFRMPGVTSSVTDAQIAAMGVCDVNQTIQYVDGLGRPIQTVNVKASPSGRDIIQPVAYDQFGREAIKYLPYVATAATSDGSYKSSAIADQASFYNAPGNSTWNAPGVVTIPTVSGITQASSTTVFEPSPLNRVLEQGAPGAAWQPAANFTGGQDHTDKVTYTTNNSTSFATDSVNGNQVRIFLANIISDNSRSLSPNGYYAPGTLYVTITKDENWVSGRAGTTEEYKDLEGHVVLKRTYNYTGGQLQQLSTYYVYDDLNNLCYVLPPGSNPETMYMAQVTYDNTCYQYWYDARNRLFRKKLPGKGWEFMVYNTLDQVTFTQDANQRSQSPQVWTFTQYDALGRIAITGIWSSATVPGSSGDSNISSPNTTLLQWLTNWQNGQTQLWITRDNTTTSGYAFANPQQGVNLTINYYDDYTFPGQPATFTTPLGSSTMTRGLLTGSKTLVLNTQGTTNDMLWTVNYYDGLGRDTVTYKQHYLGGSLSPYNYDVITTSYDFANEITATTRKQYIKNSGNTAAILNVTINNTYVYDHEGRKKQAWEAIANGSNTLPTAILISQNDYNEIGQIMTKHLHSTNSGTSFLQNIGYAYNERGWMLSSNAPLFEESLQYNTGANKQYNGNIAYANWGTQTSPDTKTYSYSYDKLNRMTSGTSLATGNNESGIAYDLMGNMTALNRYQGTSNTLIDQLGSMIYTDASGNYTNQLQSVTDNSGSNTGLVSGTTSYSYDLNGNMNLQTNAANGAQNKSITYNMLNLPLVYTLSTGTDTYTYDADGHKLRKVDVFGGTTTTEDYIDGIQYATSGAIDFIQTEEGRALNSAGTYHYEYSLTDHLGNERITFDTYSGTATTVQSDDYYPFGQDIQISVSGIKNKYLYNKKELQDEPGLGLYDYGARFYDPVIARWTSIDPLAIHHEEMTPYNYVMNNPLLYGDEFGMDTTKVHQLKEVKITAQKQKKPVFDLNDNSWVRNAPHLKPVTGWFGKTMSFLNGGRDYNGIHYDDKGNPTGVSITKMEFPFYITGPGDLEELNLVFNIIDQEGETIIYSTKIGEETITFGGDITKTDDVLTIKNFDVDGKLTNQLGRSNLTKIINQFGKQQGVKEVIIEGAKRTTGANPGRLPAVLKFMIK